MGDADRRTAVVTGGTGGLGLAVSSAFADAGYRTIVTWVVDREAEQAERALGDRVELRKLDVTDPGDVGDSPRSSTAAPAAGRSCTSWAGTSATGP